MPRHENLIVRQILATGEGAPSLDEKVDLMQSARAHSPNLADMMDRAVLQRCEQLGRGLSEAQTAQEKLKEVLEQLTVPPLHPAVFLHPFTTLQGRRALVLHGSSRRVVGVADGIDLDALSVGDEVMLNSELNVVIETSPYGAFQYGETAAFERRTADGRMVLKVRDEEVFVRPARAVVECDLKSGDMVRWDRTSRVAYEKIEKSSESSLFLEDTPDQTFDEVGGLDRQIAVVKRSVGLSLYHRDIVEKYGLRPKRGILLVGPPGTGKTMIARGLANWVATISPSGRSQFMNIKPAELHTMWYSGSEANYREVFRVARVAGEGEPDVPVVMFFDEFDAIAGTRGTSLHRIDDRVGQAFMAELDGLEGRGNILVIGATNRADALDPAFLRPGRLGDLIVEVPRPNMNAARDIFAKYLQADRPYAGAGNGRGPQEVREEIINAAVSAIYGANVDNELATLTFRDNQRLTVRSADLVNGAVIEAIAQDALEAASVREIETGQEGLRVEDVLTSIANRFEEAARVLTPANCRNHLSSLPQDANVVGVTPVDRQVRHPHRYLTLNVA